MALIGSIISDEDHMENFQLNDNVHKLLETKECAEGLLAMKTRLNNDRGHKPR